MDTNQLIKLKHSPKTSISGGFINNVDFMILAIYTHGGPMSAKEMGSLGMEWRGQDISGSLAPFYCPIAKNFAGELESPERHMKMTKMKDGTWGRPYKYPTAYIYRHGKPIVHSLTCAGMERLAQLLPECKSYLT